jgi:hypothetical protein
MLKEKGMKIKNYKEEKGRKWYNIENPNYLGHKKCTEVSDPRSDRSLRSDSTDIDTSRYTPDNGNGRLLKSYYCAKEEEVYFEPI